MAEQNTQRLAALIRNQRDKLLASWRRQVRQLPGAANLDAPTINDQVPELLDDLANALSAENENADTNTISAEHGLLRWEAGFDVKEVVTEYNILRQCLQDAAESDGIELSGKTLHVINSVFDDAIGKAVKAFETMMTIELQQRHEEHLAFVLHDLRTPLEALSLATTVLERAIPDDQRSSSTNSALSVLRGNIERLANGMRRVLLKTPALDKSIRPLFVWLKLHPQVDRIVRDLGPLAVSAGTEVKNEVDDRLDVYSDEQLLTQILQNLLSNAIKFTADGTIEIGAREIDNGRAVECWVKDSGQGIAPSRLEKVFERFETTSEPEAGGLGLGLAIVKEIVELHQGVIRVESEEGKGSTFTFVLPHPQESA
jgi:signal transduction histidine kinase